MEFQIVKCIGDEADFIGEKLVEYNLRQVPRTQETDFISINRKIVDESGNIIAGCMAELYCWNIAYIEVLWVDESYREKGLGTKLLEEIERISREENCSLIHLDTFDFQAKDFYRKNGYEVFGVLEDCPKGHCRYYMKKSLAQEV